MSAGGVTAIAAFERFSALGTLVVVGAAPGADLAGALEAVRAEVEACDRAASRFRPDSDLSRVNRAAGGRPVPVGPWLLDALGSAMDAAVATDGLVDPTVGATLVAIGYDRDFFHLDPSRPVNLLARSVPGWHRIDLDRRAATVRIPVGVHLDLGATAKARCADRAAERAAAAAGGGVLVSLGGDIAVAGPAPDGGWAVRVTDRADSAPDAPDTPGQTVALTEGALATSGTAARRWHRSGHDLHHLIDPRTGRPADCGWRTVTVAAATCVDANVASTAAVILGDEAPAWLTRRDLPARLVADDGTCTTVGRWPAELAGVRA